MKYLQIPPIFSVNNFFLEKFIAKNKLGIKSKQLLNKYFYT